MSAKNHLTPLKKIQHAFWTLHVVVLDNRVLYVCAFDICSDWLTVLSPTHTRSTTQLHLLRQVMVLMKLSIVPSSPQ